MPNYFEQKYYPRKLIRDFTRSQRNLTQAPRMYREDVKAEEITLEDAGPEGWQPTGNIDLVYRFNDDEQQTLALGFCECEPPADSEYSECYVLVYLDPSLLGLWKSEMNRERD